MNLFYAIVSWARTSYNTDMLKHHLHRHLKEKPYLKLGLFFLVILICFGIYKFVVSEAKNKREIVAAQNHALALEQFAEKKDLLEKKTNFVLQYRGYEWKIKGSNFVTWLVLDTEDKITVDRLQLEKYLAGTVLKFVANPPQNSRFEIRDGGLVEIAPGKKGFVVDIDKILNKFEVVISEVNATSENPTVSILVETQEVEPTITKETIGQYNLKDLVGQTSTSFAGSTKDREHNIKIGVGILHGMLIAPGAEFSTIISLGPVTEKEGYVKELVIKEKETIKEYGGGLCQVATTLFRLALNAGMPISERMNHRFTVPYYDPPGLDATIYGPHPDFRFVNDTGGYLLLQGRVEDEKVIMELYGEKDARTVEISKAIVSNFIPAPETRYGESTDIPVGETKCVEAAHAGVTTDVLYTVKYPNGEVKEKNFHSVYKPWQKVCLTGVARVETP